MRIFEKKNISLADKIRRVIGIRILFCFLILFLAFFVLAILNISSSFNQMEKNIYAECNILSEFTISQLLINNEKAVQVNLENINRENNALHFSWIKDTEKYSLKKNKMVWDFPFAWTVYCPISSPEGDNFGSFKVTGTLFYNQEMISSLLARLAWGFACTLIIFLLLYPLGNKIPQRLFIRPVLDLLNLLKTGKREQSILSDEKTPIEIKEIEVKLLQMLEEAQQHSREVAFGQIAAKVAHDIRSPLAALNMLLKKNVASLPEEERDIIRSATQRINDIANNLLNRKKEKDLGEVSTSNKTSPELAAILMENIVSEKRAQYSERDIQFYSVIDENAYGAFVNVNADEFNRALSNLINNSVEAIPEKGKVTLELKLTGEHSILFSLIDTGIGMYPEQLTQVLEKSVSLGKENGSGIGLSSAIQSIKSWNGTFSITSDFGKGTQVEFTLPLAIYPNWFTPVLPLQEGSTVVFLDDDTVIHQIWEKRLNGALEKNQKKFDMVHCYRTESLVKWYKENPQKCKNALFLVDYELIGSPTTGSEVIKQLNITHHAVMVTSRYDDEKVRQECQQLGIKFIPKNFAVHIPIRVFAEKPDFIFIDDDEYLTKAWKAQAELDGKKLVVFNSIKEVNTYIDCFSTDTPLYIDSNLGEAIKGEELAKTLYEKGFATIYLCTGMDESEFSNIPWIKKVLGKEYPDAGL